MNDPKIYGLGASVLKYWLPLSLLLFLSGFYWSPTSKLLNNIYYVLILLPLMLMFLVRSNRIVKIRDFIVGYRYFSGFVAAMLAASMANEISAGELTKELKRILYIVGFLVGVNVGVHRFQHFGSRFFLVLMVVASVSGSYLIVAWLGNDAVSTRVAGALAFDNPILLAATYGFAFVAALIHFLKGTDSKSGLYCLPMAVSFIVVVLCQSRGPLLALIISSMVALLISRNRRALFSAAIAILAAGFIHYHYYESRVFSVEGLRPEIWKVVLEKIQLSPWLGYGLQQPELINAAGSSFHHPHSVYLTTLYHGGLLGLVSFLIMIVAVIVRGFRYSYLHSEPTLWKTLLLFGLIYMMFDGSRVFSHPEELWLIFWLPIAYILAVTTPLNYSQNSSFTGNSLIDNNDNNYLTINRNLMQGMLLAGSDLQVYFGQNNWDDLLASARVIKQDTSRSIVVSSLPGGKKVFCKIYKEKGFLALARRRIFGSKAQRSHNNTTGFTAQGHCTPGSLGYLLCGSDNHIDTINSIHFCDYIEDARTLAEVFDNIDMSMNERQQLLEAVAAMFYKLHSNGYIHGDAKLSNILYSEDCLYFVDLDGVQPLSISRSPARDIARLLVGLAEQGVDKQARHFLFNRYCRLATIEPKSFQPQVQAFAKKFQQRHQQKYGLKPNAIF